MPKDLAALLLDEGAVSPDDLGRALDRQREIGGALDTALLEDGAITEEALLRWLSRAAELPPAPESAWAAADARARRVFPSRVAERHGLAPFALEGSELALVATYPVDLGLLDEISFMLSLHLSAHVAPEWRVRDLIHRLYGSPLPPRLAALAAAAGAPVEPPPLVPEEPPPRPAGGGGEAGAPARPAAAGFARDASEPLEPLAAALQEALESFDPALFEDEPAEGAGGDAPEGDGEEEPEEPAPPPDRSAPPHWNLDDARAALAAARDRDAVVLTAIRYARDFLEYAAVFAVTRDAVAGHDAIGLEDERERARSVAIWVSDPGILKTVIETRSPYLGPVSGEAAGNEVILSGLGREAPRTVLVYPVLLRDRPVCVVYADNGEAPVSPRRLGDLLLFLASVGSAFERIIRDRKKRRRRPPRPGAEAPVGPPPPAAVAEPVPETPIAAAEPAWERAAPASTAAADAQAAAGRAWPSPGEVDAVEGAAELAAPLEAAGPDADAPSGFVDAARTEAAASPDGSAHPDAADAAREPGRPGDTLLGVPVEAADAAQAAPATAAAAAPGAPAAESLDALEDQFFFGGRAMEAAPAGAREDGPASAPAGPPRPLPPIAPRGAGPPPPAEPPVAPRVAPAPPAPASPPDAPPPAAPPPAAVEPRARAEALTETPPPGAPSLSALADRALDPDPAASAAACNALADRRKDPAIRQAHEKLRRALLSGISTRATRAARAIAALRDVEAIPLLIQVLEASEPDTATSAADALAVITLQRLGPDARKWLGWWKENRGRGRAEWLFSGLTNPDRETRVAAAVELSLAAPPPVAYSADLPAPERERTARQWAGWWSRSGHVL